jgi:2-polyprenyl-3-methyl-5-hydroxy-6-metoxy-1,4-benzoquinol methylase
LICGTREYREIKRFDDGVVVGRCERCGLIYTPIPHPSPSELLFNRDFEEMKVLYSPIIGGEKSHFRRRNFVRYLKLIERYALGKRLLDVGCAHGFFLMTARERGYHVCGIEPSPALARVAREILNIPILQGRVDEIALEDREWDVITFTDSLEYLPNPVRDLRRLMRNLVPGGLLFLKVPNGNYFNLRHFIECKLLLRSNKRSAFGPSRRVAHYSSKTIIQLATRIGLDVIEVGSCSPIDSPVWYDLTGIWLEMESPWYIGFPGKILRRMLHLGGRVESLLTGGRNHLSQSVYLLGRKPPLGKK